MHTAGRIMRPAVCFAVLLILAGCGQSLRSLPPAGLTLHRTIAVFNDGFHSGLLVPWPDADLAFLDPRTDDAPARMPWLEVGFGADAWTRLGGGSCVAIRLSFGSSAAVLMLRHLPDMHPPPRNGSEAQVWHLSLDEQAWHHLIDHLVASVDSDLNYPRKPGVTDWVVFSRERWSVFNNCHDWTASCLETAGLDLEYQNMRTSSGFAEEMAAVNRQLAEARITVIGRAQPPNR